MSGVFANRLARMYSRDSVVVSSVKYSVSSAFVFRHVKYEYDWVNPSLAKRFISFGRVNASDRKIASACSRCTSAMTHSQNRNGLVCGLSTRNVRTPWDAQNRKTLFSSSHSDSHAWHSKFSGKMS